MIKFTKKLRAVALLTLAALCAATTGCKEEEVVPVNYSEIYYKSIRSTTPEIKELNNPDTSLTKIIRYHYPVMVGDTLDVTIMEFQSDVYALDYYMNSGKFQGSAPILRGDFLEQSFRADERIFIFRHDSFRRYERSDLENFVRGFPGYRGGFPQAFLSLPFEHREQGRTSIQTKNFLGLESKFPVLVQSYRDGGLRWNVARSWDQVSPENYEEWARKLHKVDPKGIAKDNECVYFTVDGFADSEFISRGMAQQLAGGRVVVVWGYLDWFDLERKFFNAADRVFEARY
ncbi:MAG: hypothetical protein MJY85_01390 [Fibrobacter sp.]|nr:hypothetical protein [Fibrobacter sp.]